QGARAGADLRAADVERDRSRGHGRQSTGDPRVRAPTLPAGIRAAGARELGAAGRVDGAGGRRGGLGPGRTRPAGRRIRVAGCGAGWRLGVAVFPASTRTGVVGGAAGARAGAGAGVSSGCACVTATAPRWLSQRVNWSTRASVALAATAPAIFSGKLA